MLRRVDGTPRGGLLDAAPPPRAALPADRASAAERDPRRVGAAARCARRLTPDGLRARPRAALAPRHASGGGAAALARELLRLACAADLRRRTPAPELAHPS